MINSPPRYKLSAGPQEAAATARQSQIRTGTVVAIVAEDGVEDDAGGGGALIGQVAGVASDHAVARGSGVTPVATVTTVTFLIRTTAVIAVMIVLARITVAGGAVPAVVGKGLRRAVGDGVRSGQGADVVIIRDGVLSLPKMIAAPVTRAEVVGAPAKWKRRMRSWSAVAWPLRKYRHSSA